MRNGDERLDIIDRRRLAENSSHGRKGRLDARVAATPLERVHEGRLFTADVGAGAAMDVHVHRLPTPHRVFADDACRVCFLDRSLHALDGLGELAADVDVGRLRANGVGADRAAFDQRMRRPAHDLAILERPRLGFVGVAAEVVRLAVAGLHERPFHARWEAGAATSAQAGFLHDIHDVGLRHA